MGFFSTHTSENPIFLRLLVLFLQATERNVPPDHTIQMCERHLTYTEEKIYFMCTSEVFSLFRSGFLFMILSYSEF